MGAGMDPEPGGERIIPHQLIQELCISDASTYHNFLRVDATTFDELLYKASSLLIQQDTVLHKQ